MKMKDLIQHTESGAYLPHGLTFPTYHIVERRYKKTRKHKKKPAHKISETIDQIETSWGYAHDATTGSVIENRREYVEVIEEVVPFEEWMFDSVNKKCIVIELNESTDVNSKEMSLLVEHPNLLVSQLDLDEEREIEEEEQMRIALAIGSENTGADVLKNIVAQTFASESKETMKLSLRFKETTSGKESIYTGEQNNSDASDDSDDDFDLDAALQYKVDSNAGEQGDPVDRGSFVENKTGNSVEIESSEGKQESNDDSGESEEEEDESWMNIE